MPLFSGTVESRQIIIDVLIGPAQGGEPSSSPARPPMHFRALIDTGATNTCISPKIVDDLNLIPEGKKPIATASEKTSANLYHVSFHIPVRKQVGETLKFDFHSESSMEVVEIMQPDNYDVLLGMDVLASCSLFIAGNHFTLGY